MYPRRMQQQQHPQDQGLGLQASSHPSPNGPSSQTPTAATATPLLSTQHISPQPYNQPHPAYYPSTNTITQQPRQASGQQQFQVTHTLSAPLLTHTSVSSGGLAMDSQQHQLQQQQQLQYQQNYFQQLQQFRQMREQQMQIRPGASGSVGSDSCRSTQGAIDLERHREQYQQHLLQAQQTQQQQYQQQLAAPRQPPNQSCHRNSSPQGSTPMMQTIASGSGSTADGACLLARLPPRTHPHSRASPSLGSGRCCPYPIQTRGQRDPEDAVSARTASATPELTPTRQSRGESSSTRLSSQLRDQLLLPHRTDSDSSSEYQQQPPVAPCPSLGLSEVPPTPQPPIQVHASDQSESLLPPHAPTSVYCPPRPDPAPDPDIDMPAAEEEEPIEVTLNIDIPKTSAPAAAGVPHITVLSVNPSWHCVFVETVQQLQTQLQAHPQQQQRIRTSIRIQFCPSPVSHGIVSRASAANANTGTTTTTTSSRTYGSHREKIQRLRTVQVISYASRQVELTRRICGHNLLKKGGIVIHLDPLSITFNEASYGFTLSLSSFVAESLSRIHSSSRSKPDELLPLTRQQNSAYCRRNLKELYYDTVSKDVVITVRPSGEVFYAHSVVLENYGYFRTLLEQAVQESGASTVLAGTTAGVGGEMHEESNIAGTSDNNGNSGNSAASQAAVDEEGYAQPLHTAPAPPPTAPQQQTCPQVRQWQQNNVDTNTRQNRVKIKIEIQDTHPNAFRAVLHYMYMGHVPTVVAPLTLGGRQQQPQQQMFATAATDFSSGQQSQTRVDTDTASASTSSSARLPPPPLRPLPSSLTPPAPEEFSWRELYEVATQFQLTGLMHLSKLVLIARLDAGLAVRELFEWAYRHWSLVPSYVSFLIENMEPDLLQWEQKHDGGPDAGVAGGSGAGRRRAASSTTSMAKSVLWPYHDRCPRFDDIMAMFLQMLNERKEARTLV